MENLRYGKIEYFWVSYEEGDEVFDFRVNGGVWERRYAESWESEYNPEENIPKEVLGLYKKYQDNKKATMGEKE